jgi:hypothetical protein
LAWISPVRLVEICQRYVYKSKIIIKKNKIQE